MIRSFQDLLAFKQEETSLCLSDTADFGVSAYLNAKANLAKPFRSLLELEGMFQNIPAVLVGAGPSLEKASSWISRLAKKGLIFCGGTGLSKISCSPHFGACIDGRSPALYRQSFLFPLCFSARAHPDSLRLFEGERLLAPDSHWDFLNYLSGDESLFRSGWTVGNFMAAVALHLGCNPIVSVGMEYCYKDEQKYAFDENAPLEGLVEAQDSLGNRIKTQKDWQMAIRWMEEIKRQNPSVCFLNASEEGMKYWNDCSIGKLQWEDIPNLAEKVEMSVKGLSLKRASLFEKWEESLRRSLRLVQEGRDSLKDEVVYRYLLSPLWNLWGPALESDSSSIYWEREKALHKRVFFETAIQEHLYAIG